MNLRKIVVSFVLVFTSTSAGEGQEKWERVFQHLRAQRNLIAPANQNTGSILIQQHPLVPTIRELPQQSSTLGAVLAKNELSALAIRKLSENIPTPQSGQRSENSNGDLQVDIRLRSYAPKFAMVIRGKKATIFPASFVIAPQVQNCIIKDGDIVATFQESRTTASLESGKSSHLEKFVADCFLTKPTSEGGSVTVFGSHVPKQLVKTQEFEADEMELVPFVRSPDSGALENQLIALLPNLQNQVERKIVVGVLHKKARGYDVQIVFPLKQLGMFGSNGTFFRSLVRDSNVRQDKIWMESKWDEAFDKNSDITLFDGDSVEITTIEFVSLFNPLAR